jgi:dienelactone hydrolase
MVFGHGAGTGNHTAFAEHAAGIAGDGIVCLVPDKDLRTYSIFHRDYEHIARQYVDLAKWARRQPWADPARVGYYGESEGAWIAPLCAALDPEAGFVALISAPVVTGREQSGYAAATYLESVDAPIPLFDAAVRFVGAPMPFGTIEYGDFDVRPYLSALTMPVFMAYGTGDISMPIDQGAQIVMADAPGPVAVRYYAGANHGIRVGEDYHVAHDFLRDLSGWVRSPRTVTGAAGDRPHQEFRAGDVPRAQRLTTQGLAAAASLAAIGASTLPWGRVPAPARHAFTLFRLGAVGTVAAYMAYLGRIIRLATTYAKDPIGVVWGYRAVLAAGLVSLGAGWETLRRAPRPTAKLAIGGGGATLLLGWVAYWGGLGSLRRFLRAPRDPRPGIGTNDPS